MAQLIAKPTVIPAAGRPPKIIEEFIGRVNSKTNRVSIAKMTSPSGWREPGQTPEFDECTLFCAVNYRSKRAMLFTKSTQGKLSS